MPIQVAHEVEDVLTAIALVASGFGMCVTTESAGNLRLPGVAYRPLVARALKDVELNRITRDDDRSPLLDAFLTVVRAYAKEHAANALHQGGAVGDTRSRK